MNDLVKRLRSIDIAWNEQGELAAEAADRIEALEALMKAWLEKTEWVQQTATPLELGLHRADVLRCRIEALKPLNLEQIRNGAKAHGVELDDVMGAYFHWGVRYAEQRHGIGGSNV